MKKTKEMDRSRTTIVLELQTRELPQLPALSPAK